jgi:hypothetical protein
MAPDQRLRRLLDLCAIVFTDNRPLHSPKSVVDGAQQRTLPATKANLALTSL